MVPVKYKPATVVIEQDGRYGWIVVASAFMVSFLTDGIIFSFGLILVELVEDFKLSRASTALIGALLSSFCHLIGPVAGSILDMYGGRGVVLTGAVLGFIGVFASYFAKNVLVLYVTYGVIAGTGFGLMYAPANACVIKHFTKRRTLAQGVAMCGTGFGTFVMNLLVGYLIREYGWRGAILISSGMLLNGLACGLVLLPPSKTNTNISIMTDSRKPTSFAAVETQSGTVALTDETHSEMTPLRGSANSGTLQLRAETHSSETPQLREETGDSNFKGTLKELLDFSALRDYRCVFFMASTFVSNLAFALPFHLLPDQVAQDGVSAYRASLLVSIIGFTNTISRIVNGWIGDRACVNRPVMFESFVFLCGVSLAVSPAFRTFETKLIFSCLYGVSIGGYIILLPVVLADIFGEDIIGKMFGFNRFMIGLADLIAAPIGGWIFDYTGSYTLTFIIAGCEYVIGGILLICPSIIKRCQHKA